MHFLQMAKKRKTELYGRIIIVLYLGLFSSLVFFLMKHHIHCAPPFMITLTLLTVAIPDFVFKLIFEPDNTVMDAFLKTRPVPLEKWRKFLVLSNFWEPANLEMPLIMAPLCFLCLPLGGSILVFLTLYILSVLNGLLIMIIKHRGPYQLERNVSVSRHNDKDSPLSHHARFGLQCRSILRSKRLKTNTLLLGSLFLLNYVAQSLGNNHLRMAEMQLFFFILIGSSIPQQYGLGIEASFFSAIWTKPVSISRILADKYWTGIIMGSIAALLVLPLCIWVHTSVLALFSYVLFGGGFGGLFLLIDAYKCSPFDLFGKTYFNYQGASGTYKPSIILGFSILIGIGIAIPLLLSKPYSYIILSTLGMGGIVCHRRFFQMVEQAFLRNRYIYMEKYFES